MCINLYIHICVCTCIYMYTYIPGWWPSAAKWLWKRNCAANPGQRGRLQDASAGSAASAKDNRWKVLFSSSGRSWESLADPLWSATHNCCSDCLLNRCPSTTAHGSTRTRWATRLIQAAIWWSSACNFSYSVTWCPSWGLRILRSFSTERSTVLGETFTGTSFSSCGRCCPTLPDWIFRRGTRAVRPWRWSPPRTPGLAHSRTRPSRRLPVASAAVHESGREHSCDASELFDHSEDVHFFEGRPGPNAGGGRANPVQIFFLRPCHRHEGWGKPRSRHPRSPYY